MTLYAAIDLHSTNSYLVVLDDNDTIIYQKRLSNSLEQILRALSPYRGQIQGIAVESTYNWYWLVDGLKDAGFRVHLVNTTKATQYSGLKFAGDKEDAAWLAHLLRLGILPTGYIYPQDERGLRDLLRDRMRLVNQRTMYIVSMHARLARLTGKSFVGKQITDLTEERLHKLVPDPHACLSLVLFHQHIVALNCSIARMEETLKPLLKEREGFKRLTEICGIGPILGMTILLETGDVQRFSKVGNYASYCRCVGSKRISNGKVKGQGNRKNGNRYLGWAYIEAANFMIQHSPAAKAYYHKKANKTKPVIARKAIAHKISRACYYVLRDKVAFEASKMFH